MYIEVLKISFINQERTKNAQFIIISLRSNMFELADFLVGIYKVEDCTRSLTIQNFDKQRVLGFGEKEGEKENQNTNSLLSPTVSSGKENSPIALETMDTSENNVNASQNHLDGSMSPLESQPVM